MLPLDEYPARDKTLVCCGHNTASAGACFSDDRRHRYGLWRRWNAHKKSVAFLMLNPSDANEDVLDPTVNRTIDFAKSKDIDAGGLEVVNMFPLVSRYPKDLIVDDRDGNWDINTTHIISVIRNTSMLILAFGQNVHTLKHLRPAVTRLRQVLEQENVVPFALKVTKHGLPGHPLYLRSDRKPEVYHWPS